MGNKDGAVGWVVDFKNASLISTEMKQRADTARDDIIAGRLKVVDYTTANACPL